mmetsp:Transcript_970/g.2786  ORF Transcript_970/g.2786 Transcript_970/m.2786 type:complete len:586 (+) Transcript_970:303-2060(+)
MDDLASRRMAFDSSEPAPILARGGPKDARQRTVQEVQPLLLLRTDTADTAAPRRPPPRGGYRESADAPVLPHHPHSAPRPLLLDVDRDVMGPVPGGTDAAVAAESRPIVDRVEGGGWGGWAVMMMIIMMMVTVVLRRSPERVRPVEGLRSAEGGSAGSLIAAAVGRGPATAVERDAVGAHLDLRVERRSDAGRSRRTGFLRPEERGEETSQEGAVGGGGVIAAAAAGGAVSRLSQEGRRDGHLSGSGSPAARAAPDDDVGVVDGVRRVRVQTAVASARGGRFRRDGYAEMSLFLGRGRLGAPGAPRGGVFVVVVIVVAAAIARFLLAAVVDIFRRRPCCRRRRRVLAIVIINGRGTNDGGALVGIVPRGLGQRLSQLVLESRAESSGFGELLLAPTDEVRSFQQLPLDFARLVEGWADFHQLLVVGDDVPRPPRERGDAIIESDYLHRLPVGDAKVIPTARFFSAGVRGFLGNGVGALLIGGGRRRDDGSLFVLPRFGLLLLPLSFLGRRSPAAAAFLRIIVAPLLPAELAATRCVSGVVRRRLCRSSGALSSFVGRIAVLFGVIVRRPVGPPRLIRGRSRRAVR